MARVPAVKPWQTGFRDSGTASRHMNESCFSQTEAESHALDAEPSDIYGRQAQPDLRKDQKRITKDGGIRPMSQRERLERIEKQLGKPTHRGESFLLYEGDCLQLMQSMSGSHFDLTVTSPPYNIGKEYETVQPIEHYVDWCEQWIADIYRLTERFGSFWLNAGYLSLPGRAKAIPIPYLLWDRVPFYLIQEIVWHYGAGVAARLSFSPRNEKFLWFVKDSESYTFDLEAVRDPNVKYPNQKKNGKLKCNPKGKNPTDVWEFPKVTSGRFRSSKERTNHPAQFPVAVIERVIRASSRPGDVVFDPFLGSGTTIEAALRNDRLAVGFEVDHAYVQTAIERIEHAQEGIMHERAQGALFSG